MEAERLLIAQITLACYREMEKVWGMLNFSDKLGVRLVTILLWYRCNVCQETPWFLHMSSRWMIWLLRTCGFCWQGPWLVHDNCHGPWFPRSKPVGTMISPIGALLWIMVTMVVPTVTSVGDHGYTSTRNMVPLSGTMVTSIDDHG